MRGEQRGSQDRENTGKKVTRGKDGGDARTEEQEKDGGREGARDKNERDKEGGGGEEGGICTGTGRNPLRAAAEDRK